PARWLILGESRGIPTPLAAMVVAWMMLISASYGFVVRTATVRAVRPCEVGGNLIQRRDSTSLRYSGESSRSLPAARRSRSVVSFGSCSVVGTDIRNALSSGSARALMLAFTR